MSHKSPRVAFLTAGAAGMYCGACLHDNALAGAMRRRGVDWVLIPLYTPIRTDEVDHSVSRIFYGGVNLYLRQRFSWFQHIPTWIRDWLDHPAFLRRVAQASVRTDPEELGELALEVLRGEDGSHQMEIRKLCEWLKNDLRPDCLMFSNLLISGAAARIQRELHIPVVAVLQGDDLFLDSLPPNSVERAEGLLKGLARNLDAFFVHSRYYADFMSRRLSIPPERFRVVPLGISLPEEPWPIGRLAESEPAGISELGGEPGSVGASSSAAGRTTSQGGPCTVGYLARLAPEKGLDLLIDAFLKLRRVLPGSALRLRVAGWQGPQHDAYRRDLVAKVAEAGASSDVEWLGELERSAKFRFLDSLDLLSVPTRHPEPKGLFVLEALSRGVPVVVPDHGAFPELIANTEGGILVPPHDVDRLADGILELVRDPARRRELGQRGATGVQARYAIDRTAEVTWREVESIMALHRRQQG